MNEAISVQVLITVVGFVITILTFTNTRKKDLEDDTKERTKMYTKVDETCNRINEILRSVDKMSIKFDDVSHLQLRHDEQIKNVYRMLDDHDDRLKKLEDK